MERSRSSSRTSRKTVPTPKAEVQPIKAVLSESLAVKYRPHRITHLIGQPHVVTQLKGMYKSKKFPAAFLIEGQYGGGKTTVARLIHSMLNCEKGTICGKCSSCLMGTKGHPDLINVNAGKDGKVDDIRNLVRSAEVAPMFNKKIIVVDEAHKLTGAAAEALLVPIEEPTPNTVWILCTTNPEKMLSTIRSRCLKLSMKPIEPSDIISRLSYIAQQEGHDLSALPDANEILELIADFSNGSMRDAISLLESVLYAVASGDDFTKENVLKSFVENTEVDLDKAAVSLVAASLNNDIKGAIRAIKKTANVRGLVSKSRWLIDYLVCKIVKCAKYTPYSGRLFEAIAEKEEIKIKFSSLLLLQSAITDAEMKMNNTSIDEGIIMQSAITKYLFGLEE